MKTVTLKDFYGKVMGYIEVEDNGNKIVKNFYKQVLGYYDVDRDVTLNFYKQVLFKGDMCSMLIGMDPSNNSKK